MENTSSVIDTTTTELPILEEPVVTEPTVTEEPVVTEPVPSGPVYITTFDELVATHGAIVQQEIADKASLLSVFQPTPEILKTRLIIWASLGFPPNWQVLSTYITPPRICCDGEIRDATEYSLYLLDTPIDSFLTNLNSQVPGVMFSFFMSNAHTIGLSVVKA
jgi:hypothetical protein